MPTPPKSHSTRRKSLTRKRVLQAALRLADQGGIAALTMRKLAETLGVEAMSLYHHVAGKEAILDGIVDAVFDEITLPVAGDHWRQAMQVRAVSAREVLLRHEWAVGLLESRVNPGPATLCHHDAVLGCLRRAGFSVPLAAAAFSLLDSYTYGFVLQELSLPFDSSEELEQVVEEILAQMPADQYPYLTEMARDYTLQPGYAYGNEFLPGLELILDGLERFPRNGSKPA